MNLIQDMIETLELSEGYISYEDCRVIIKLLQKLRERVKEDPETPFSHEHSKFYIIVAAEARKATIGRFHRYGSLKGAINTASAYVQQSKHDSEYFIAEMVRHLKADRTTIPVSVTTLR